MITQDLGIATAYGYAKSKGYTGTEAEFAELMASYAEVGQTAVTAAQTATTKASEAATSATTATTKASEATTAAQTATTKAGEASTSANTATSAKDTAVSASQTATTKASEATTAAATATSAATTATTAKDDAVSAKTAAQTAQTGAETAAASVQASAAQIQTNADDISELKEDLTGLDIPLELVATYENKILRKTGMQNYNGFNVYQFAIPEGASTVHLKTNFYGNVFIVFTDMDTDGDFSSEPHQYYPSSGYPSPTTVDDDFDTKGFSYVWIPLCVGSGVTASASASYKNVVDAVVHNTIISNNTNGGITDLNNAERNHIYVFSIGISNLQNYPPITNGGTLLCYAAYDIDNVQLFISNQNAVFFRRMWGTTWGSWKQIQTEDTVQTIVNTAVNTAFSAYYPYNILSAFKNITCIGDSLTYSQVYTGASTSRQAYKPYPKVIADRAGATETILATPGDTATQAWDRNSENIVQKDAQLTLVYLGTNGGLTDTMDTDMVGDDYTQWADTNTGNYGKIVAKSIAVGSRVVLIKVHSSSGGVDVTNTVIEKMATRFNVPYIDNVYLSGAKYHSYPDGSGTNGTHYNDFGYSVFADQIANSISKLSAEDAVKIIPI